MCDYSLMETNSRLALDGEELEVYRFPSGAKGFVAVPRPVTLRLCSGALRPPEPVLPSVPCAVCVPPGARLILHDIPGRLQSQLGVCDTEEVTFTQLLSEAACSRDAVRFDQGCVLSLQELGIGQHVEVINTSSPDEAIVFDPRELEQVAA